jgi:exodeoxyribonuclease V alpha subunit
MFCPGPKGPGFFIVHAQAEKRDDMTTPFDDVDDLSFIEVEPVRVQAQPIAQDRVQNEDSARRILLPCILGEKPIHDSGEGNFVIVDACLSKSDIDLLPDDMGFPNEWMRNKFRALVKTEMETINPFVTYMLSGFVTEHPKYGKQFTADYYYLREINDTMSLVGYLDRMPHLGRKRASEIVDRFGREGMDGISRAMENDGLALTVVNGITPERAKQIAKCWERDISMRDLYMWMIEMNLPIDKANDIFVAFGRKSKAVIEQNPYVLASIKGIGFKIADALAHKMGEVNPVQRVGACAEYVLNEGMRGDGHLCAHIDNLARLVEQQLRQFKPQEDFRNAYAEAIKKGFVTIRMLNRTFVYLPGVFSKEKDAACGFADIACSESFYSVSPQDIDLAQDDVSVWSGRKITLDKCQRDAITSAFCNRATIITGGGGTGKSTICQCIKTIAERQGMTVTFLAPTGAAAKVLTDKTGADAMTIHRALGILPNSKSRKADDRPVSCDILVVDEFSMVGIDTVAHVIKTVAGCKNMNLVIVGDPQQLPSVSPGNFLFDFIASSVAPVIKLTNVHRQSETSYIPQVADEMAKGIFSGIPSDATDITVCNTDIECMMVQSALSLAREYKEKRGTLDGFQMISSMRVRGDASVEAMNDAMQSVFFDPEVDPHVEYNNRKFFIGDRVMQKVNDYDRNVFNGNIGRVVDCGTEDLGVGRSGKYVVVEFPNSPINGVDQPPEICKYVKKQIDDLMHCWCSTVHKFQGSQADTIVFLAPPAHAKMIKRELVYTAMTRASKMLHLVGSAAVIAKATMSSLISTRNTHTREFAMLKAGTLHIPDLYVRNRHLDEVQV